MMLSIFETLYEIFGDGGDQSQDYRIQIYNPVGFGTTGFALLVALFFYLLLGRWKEVWYSSTHWLITLFLFAGLCFGFAMLMAHNVLQIIDPYLIQFSIVNAVWGSLLFFIFSIFLKRFSIYSKHSPF